MAYWRKSSGSIIGNIIERQTTSITLPIDSTFIPLNENNLEISIISGSLPKGMRLVDNNIIGTPFEVAIDTIYSFVLRANNFGNYEDRTFRVKVVGPDIPVWQTPEGLLQVGNNQRYFIIDSAIIDFQLIATDSDSVANQPLEYFLETGELPPGIRLTKDGRLVGIVEPIIALEKGEIVEEVFSDNGFDSYYYDLKHYDYFDKTLPPKKLNRYYNFTISVSDGVDIVKRDFEIYVVAEDFLRADNTIMQVANGIFTADNTFIRNPIWLTPENFGYKRANNYITLSLDVLDLNTSSGIIKYTLLNTNPDQSQSLLPKGLTLDTDNGIIAGISPYQQAVTTQYKFTIRASRILPNYVEDSYKDRTFTITMLGEVDSTINFLTPKNLGILSTNNISTLNVIATTTVTNAIVLYNIEKGALPPGLSLSLKGEILGIIKSFGQGTYKSIWKTNIFYSKNDIVSFDGIFYIATIAHTSSNFINDSANWIEFVNNSSGVTTFDNGNLKLDLNTTTLNRIYKFTVKARDHLGYSSIIQDFELQIQDPDNKIFSNIYASPMLPTTDREKFSVFINSETNFPYEYIYRPSDKNFGIQKKMKMLVYAGIETKTANYFMAALAKNNKRKKYKLGELKTAVAKKPGTNDIVYEVVYIDVIDPANSYDKFNPTKKFVRTKSKKNITVDQTLYQFDRYSVELPPPIGITIKTNEYGEVNHFFDPKFIVTSRYNVPYLIDIKPLTINSEIIVTKMIEGPNEPYRFRPAPENTVKADFNGIKVDGYGQQEKYISNIHHSRDELKQVGETEIEFMPLWMRTAQGNNVAYLGYVTAIPLCYCIPGTSKEILQILKNQNINFLNYNFEIDRFIIDTVEGDAEDTYIAFHNYNHNI